MIVKKSNEGHVPVVDGVTRKTLAVGEKTLLGEFTLEKGKTLPAHQHPEEQTGYLISGKMIFTIAGEKYEVTTGDSWSIPGNVEHSVEVIEDSFLIEVFSPVRKDFLPENN